MNLSVALAAVSPIIQALDFIDKKWDEIKDKVPSDAAYYIGYLDIAKQAIEGIEGEYIAILLMGARCVPGDHTGLDEFKKRLNDYQFKEILRPKLANAIERLREGLIALEQHEASYFVFPNIRNQRKFAIQQFESLLGELDRYLAHLGNWHGGSGAALQDIVQLNYVAANSPSELSDACEKLLLTVDKSNLFMLTNGCSRAIESVRLAFR